MILRIQHKELTIDLDLRERIILHLAQDIPLPKNTYDPEALPRTTMWMMKHFDATFASIYRLMRSMVDEGVLTIHNTHLHTNAQGPNTYVYVLTPEGQLLADAIKRRAV